MGRDVIAFSRHRVREGAVLVLAKAKVTRAAEVPATPLPQRPGLRGAGCVGQRDGGTDVIPGPHLRRPLDGDGLDRKLLAIDDRVRLVDELRELDLVPRLPHLLRVLLHLRPPVTPPAKGPVGGVILRPGVRGQVRSEAQLRLGVKEQLHLGERGGAVFVRGRARGHQVGVRDVAPIADVTVVREALRLARADDGVEGVRKEVGHLRDVRGVRVPCEEDNLLGTRFAKGLHKAALGSGKVGEGGVRVADLEVGASVEDQPQVRRLLQLAHKPGHLVLAEEGALRLLEVVHISRVCVQGGAAAGVGSADRLEAGRRGLVEDVSHAQRRLVGGLLIEHDEAHHERRAVVVEGLGPGALDALVARSVAEVALVEAGEKVDLLVAERRAEEVRIGRVVGEVIVVVPVHVNAVPRDLAEHREAAVVVEAVVQLVLQDLQVGVVHRPGLPVVGEEAVHLHEGLVGVRQHGGQIVAERMAARAAAALLNAVVVHIVAQQEDAVRLEGGHVLPGLRVPLLVASVLPCTGPII
mmetsp:Transcript_66469/g.184033  ORF Transcript_66469/g.184033 Transcript_66469/m.184033 type:complete len:524 (-) Transcript_66469:282-1853(-)